MSRRDIPKNKTTAFVFVIKLIGNIEYWGKLLKNLFEHPRCYRPGDSACNQAIVAVTLPREDKIICTLLRIAHIELCLFSGWGAWCANEFRFAQLAQKRLEREGAWARAIAWCWEAGAGEESPGVLLTGLDFTVCFALVALMSAAWCHSSLARNFSLSLRWIFRPVLSGYLAAWTCLVLMQFFIFN